MPIIHSIATGATGLSSFTLDAGFLVARIANILQRQDADDEILYWLNFVERDVAKKLRIKSLRTSTEIVLVPMPAFPVPDSTLYYYVNLPADFSHIDHVFYKNTTDSNNVWGKNLTPLPREFYAGDIVDIEKLMNVSAPAVGDPQWYWLEALRLGFYPGLAAQNAGKIQLWYYKIPPDMTTSLSVPSIPADLRHYLIILTVFWGKLAFAQDSADLPTVGFWKRQYQETLDIIGRYARESETKVERFSLPDTGLEHADSVF